MPGTKTNLKLHWNNFLITLCKFSFTILNLKWLCEPIYTQVTIFIRNKMHVWKHLLYLWVILNYKYIHICYETSLLLWNTKCDENFRFTDYDKWFDYISHDLKHKICPEISTVPRMNKMTGWYKQVSVIIIWGREKWFYFCFARFYKHLC